MKNDCDVIINEYKELVKRQTEEIGRLDAKVVELMRENACLREENDRLKHAQELPPITVPAPSIPTYPTVPPYPGYQPWWPQPFCTIPCTIKQSKEAGV